MRTLVSKVIFYISSPSPFQDNSVNKRRELGMIPKINFPYFKPRVSLYGEPNLDEAIRSKCRFDILSNCSIWCGTSNFAPILTGTNIPVPGIYGISFDTVLLANT